MSSRHPSVPPRFRSRRCCFYLPGLSQLILLAAAMGLPSPIPAADSTLPPAPLAIITNVSQFRTLSGEDLHKFPFHLTGTATLVDRDRNLLVLQDATGAVAVNLDLTNISVYSG